MHLQALFSVGQLWGVFIIQHRIRMDPVGSMPIGLPQLADFSAKICSKTLPSDPSNAAMSCILELQLDKGTTSADRPNLSNVTLELQPSTLNTLVEGMSRIRDQLASVANKK